MMGDNTMLNGRVIGLTGPTGSGKTSASALICQWKNVLVVDADAIAHDVMENDVGCRAELVREFSPAILGEGENLDRKALASIVFDDPAKLVRLGVITYPYIITACVRHMNDGFAAGMCAAFLDAPTLFESGADRLCEQIVSVITPREERLRRILRRDGITREAAEQRMKNQYEDAYYIERSDFVIHNDSDWEHLKQEVENCRNYLQL